MSDELFDVCDENDRVIGQAPRAQVHARRLLHRAVHIWLWNSQAELMIHRRSATKDEYPGCYTSSASGHLAVGEDYLTAAHRELWEELHLRGKLSFQTKLPASAETSQEHTVLYFLESDEPPRPDPNEIAEIVFLHPDRIDDMLHVDPERFTPPFRSLFHWWRELSRDDKVTR